MNTILTEIPNGWSMMALGRLVRFGNGSDYKDVEVADGGYPVYGSGGVFRRASRFLYDGESVLFGRKGTIDRPLYVTGRFWTVDTMYYTIPGPRILPKFLYYAAATIPFSYYATNTAVPSMTQGALASHRIPLPPLDEQRAIAGYLDHETAQIDALVSKQEEFIGLLRERRSAVRAALATKGGAPDADLAPTDLVWAPAVPATWRVVPLTSIAKLESGHTPSRSHPEWWQDVYIPWISLNDVSALSDREYISETVNLISDAGIANSSARLLPAGTVVLSRDATIGRSAIMEIPMATSQHFADWVCGPTLNPRYLWLLFTSAMQQYFDSLTDGSTIKTIGMGDLRACKIPLPPLDEQERIVSRAHNATTHIDALIAKAEELIALAKERRSALITAAVTGQIDVRTAARKAS